MGATNDGVRVLRFWQAVAIFSPQSLPGVDPRTHIVDVMPGEPMPWEPGSWLASQPIKPDQVWRHEVFGGIYEVRGVRDVLVRQFDADNPNEDEQAPARGQSALFACTVDAEGMLVEESAVLSACAWAVGQALTPGWPSSTWIDDFGQDVLHYGNDLVKLAGSKWETGVRFLATSMRTALPAAVEQGVQAVVAGALAPVGGPLAAAGGAAAGSVAGDLARTAIGASDTSTSGGEGPRPSARLDLRALTGKELQCFAAELADRLGVAEELAPRGIRVKSYRISIDRANEAPQQSFLNSFYIDDLKRVGEAFSAGDAGSACVAYLTSSQRLSSAGRVDVQTEPLVMRAGNMPQRIPLGRWVTSSGQALAFSQQFAVNQIVEQLAESAGLLAVNGPPGTGKTTMLRDIVAAVIVERALRLAELSRPQDAFTGGRYEWKTSSWTHYVAALRPEVTGFEMVVASSNNGAVENITTEIPGAAAVAAQWNGAVAELNYFSETAKLVCGDGAWAMVAARLGNRSNRNEFSDRFWWGKVKGNDTAGLPSGIGERGDSASTGFGMKNVLKQLRTVSVDWSAAVADFRQALDKVRALAADRQAVAKAIELRPAKNYERKRIAGELGEAEADCAALSAQQPELERRSHQASEDWQAANSVLEAHQRYKPGLLISLSTWFRAGREWHHEHRRLHQEANAAAENWVVARRAAADLQERLATARQHTQRTRADLDRVTRELTALQRRIEQAKAEWGSNVPAGPEYWETRRTELIDRREKSAPWADTQFAAGRTELFLAALRLHKTFITAAAPTISKNLNALIDILKGAKGRPQDRATLAAWQTLFLVVPVVSSTFASFDRLFAGLGRESLGWLFVDEAGQGAPHEGAGAIWRARRAVVVGDPLQLEPVVTLPWGGQQALLNKFAVSEEWAPSRTSVQAVADRLARYGTWLPSAASAESGRVWVGTPLRVHRRCDQPMFKICNQIAYGGLMVYGTPDRPDFHGQSIWYDVRSNDARGHWIPAEGRVLHAILTELKNAGIPPREIRVLSPFRRVVAGAKNEYGHVFSDSDVSVEDRNKWVGTIHTMQGKEADVVIFILGTHPQRSGSRRWAARNPNLLNVAVSRARRRLYVIGNWETWSGLNYFNVLASNITKCQPPTTGVS